MQKGRLIDPKTKKPLIFEVLISQESFVKVLLPFQKNLNRIGITLEIKRVDLSQYINRLRAFDYDMMVTIFGQSNWPGNEQRDYWHSGSANIKGSRNYIGIENKAIDRLVEQLIQAGSATEQAVIAKALDRVLLWHYFVIPHWHINKYRISYWNKFRYPAIAPKYGFTTFTWWIDTDQERKMDSYLKK